MYFIFFHDKGSYNEVVASLLSKRKSNIIDEENHAC